MWALILFIRSTRGIGMFRIGDVDSDFFSHSSAWSFLKMLYCGGIQHKIIDYLKGNKIWVICCGI